MATTNFENAELNLVIIDQKGIATSAFLRNKDTVISRTIDLGMVSLRDAAIYGRTRPLIPYAEGRLIKSVSFVPGGDTLNDTAKVFFVTPNTVDAAFTNRQGFGAIVDNNLGHALDTDGLIYGGKATQLDGNSGSKSHILDCGPLFGMIDVIDVSGRAIGSWTPNTIWSYQDAILDENDHIQVVQVGGVGGPTEPTWDDSGGDVYDGTAVFHDDGLVPDGSVHVIVEVIEGASQMPKYPATIEFVAPPADVVAGETMPDVTVIVKDQNGDPYLFTPVQICPMIKGAGTLLGTQSAETDQMTGIATFSDLSIVEPANGYIIRAVINPTLVADPIFSPPFDVTL